MVCAGHSALFTVFQAKILVCFAVNLCDWQLFFNFLLLMRSGGELPPSWRIRLARLRSLMRSATEPPILPAHLSINFSWFDAPEQGTADSVGLSSYQFFMV
ncbi:MAG: hypothetical protein SOI56_03975 [Eubacteriales bacterium]|jgi:hypothetical protein